MVVEFVAFFTLLIPEVTPGAHRIHLVAKGTDEPRDPAVSLFVGLELILPHKRTLANATVLVKVGAWDALYAVVGRVLALKAAGATRCAHVADADHRLMEHITLQNTDSLSAFQAQRTATAGAVICIVLARFATGMARFACVRWVRFVFGLVDRNLTGTLLHTSSVDIVEAQAVTTRSTRC